ncbi:MAG TPA: SMP-30/gluconolactonase/LRE family protein [Polyangia bacterium]
MERRSVLWSCVVAGLVTGSGLAIPSLARAKVTVGTSVVKPEAAIAFVEGPAWHKDGSLFFSDVENNRIMRLDSAGRTHVFRSPAGRANGLVFDAQGRLLAAEGGWAGGNRRVTRTEADGSITVLADKFEGKRLNSPNDITVDAKGRVYFTDPRYGDRSDLEQLDASGKPIEAVYRIDPDKSIHRLTTTEVERPNGVAVSPDGKYLYVIDNQNSTAKGNRKVWRFDLQPDGNLVLASRKVIHDFSPGRGGDGMEIDSKGRLFVAAGFNLPNPPLETAATKAGIYVFSPEGKRVDFIPVPMDMVTNVAFGGNDLKTLYITAGHSVFSVRVDTPGNPVWPRPQS